MSAPELLAAVSRGFELLTWIEDHGDVPGERLYRTLVAEAVYAREIGDDR
jgi:hypothetical protein